jgi:hypothetical protein
MMLIAVLGAAISLGQAVSEVACWSENRLESGPIVRAYDTGYVLTIAPSANPDLEYGCRVEVRDNSGRVVFAGEGFNTRLHPESGRDVDGDGHGDLIIGVDSGGGNRCCWEYSVISLYPAARVLAGFDNPAFETDAQGRTVVWTTVALYDLGPSMAASPTLEIAEQFRSGQLVDVTAEYCDAMFAGTVRGYGDLSGDLALVAEPKKTASKEAGRQPSYEIGETRAAAYTIALQLTYCGRSSSAAALIREVWPDSMQAEVTRNVTDAVARERSQRHPAHRR